MAVAARIPRPRARGESHAGRRHAPPAQRRGCGHGREPGLTSAQAAALWGGRPVCREWPDAAAPDPGVTAEPSAPRSAPRSPRRERRSRRCPPLPCPLGTLRRPSPLSCLSSPRSAEIRVVWHGPPATAGQRGPTAGVSRVTRPGRGPQGRAPLRGWGRCWQWGWAGEACAALCRAPSRRASPGAHGVPVQHQLGELLPLFLDVGDLHLGGKERQGGEPRGPGLRGRERRVYLDCFSLRRSSRPRFTPHISKRQRPPEARRAGGKHAPRRCCTGGPRPPSPRRPRAATARGPAGSRPLRTSPASSFKRQAHVHPSGRRAHAGPALPSAGPQRTGTPPARGHRPAGRPTPSHPSRDSSS